MTPTRPSRVPKIFETLSVAKTARAIPPKASKARRAIEGFTSTSR
jgi:hypothetical protein